MLQDQLQLPQLQTLLLLLRGWGCCCRLDLVSIMLLQDTVRCSCHSIRLSCSCFYEDKLLLLEQVPAASKTLLVLLVAVAGSLLLLLTRTLGGEVYCCCCCCCGCCCGCCCCCCWWLAIEGDNFIFRSLFNCKPRPLTGQHTLLIYNIDK